MLRKIIENATIFLFLLGLAGFFWAIYPQPPEVGAISLTVATPVGVEAEEVWESDYPASLLPNEKINVNTASQSDLTRLPSIGDTRAAAIIAYRTEFGDFTTVEQITEVYGIGEGILASIAPYIILE